MSGLVRAEFRKLLSTQVWFWLLVASVGVTALLVIVQLAARPDLSAANVNDVFTAGQVADVGPFVLGVLAVTTEFRYQTITPTFLATPSRWRLIGAKFVAYALTGIAYAFVCVLVTVVVAVPWLNSKGIEYSWSDQHVTRGLVGVFVVMVLYALLGLGVGALLKNQIAAVVVGLVYTLILENVLIRVLPYVRDAYPYLPGGAANAIVEPHQSYFNPGNQVLGTAGGVIVLLVWAGVLSVAGAAFSMNRDIT